MASVKQTLKAFNSQQEIQLRQMFESIRTDLDSYKTIYDAHTHKLPATPIEDENTSAPDTTAATGSKAPGTASAFTTTTSA